MDMRFIEVGIGLTIVFAMASLLATAMMEAWSSYRSLRGRNLMNALVSFVGDDKKFAKRLMNHPLMVSLSVGQKDDARCPSYIAADVVVTSLMALLFELGSDGQRPQTPIEFIGILEKAVAEKKAWAPDADFVRGLKSLTYGVENDWRTFEMRICAWYDAVGERSIGWYKRKVQVRLFYCGFVIALVGNINPLELAPSLWSSEPVRIGLVGATDAVLAVRPPTEATETPAPATSEATEVLVKTVVAAQSAGLPIGWSVPFPPRQVKGACAWEGKSLIPGPAECGRWAMVFNLLVVLMGWSITAIACTLGSPFWFDILSKAAKLRATGKRPDPAAEKAEEAPAASLLARPMK